MLALCMAFRNEETQLAGALHSCYKIIDKAYFINNASTDRSREMAEYWCLKAGVPYAMLDEPEATGWPDHLLNRALDLAQAEGASHTLLLDADERLTGHGRQEVKRWVEADIYDAYAVPRRTIITPYCPTAGGEIEPYTDSIEFNEHHYRLFRSGAVRYPEAEGPHIPPTPRSGASSYQPPLNPTWITHDRDGWEQMRRDRLRGQYRPEDFVPLWQTRGGWFDYSNLYDLAVRECRDGGTMVELGNYLGRSLLYLGKCVQESGKSIRIVGCDKYRMTPSPFQHVEIFETGCRWLQETAKAVHRAGLADTVSLLQWPSAECAKLFEDGSVDFCFVDADHDRPGVDNDLKAWWPKIRNGGIFAGHDWSEIFPGVMGAVSEFAEREGLELDVTTSPGSWLVRKQ